MADRETAIVLTNPWHERDARSLSESLGAPVFAPPDDDGTGMRMPARDPRSPLGALGCTARTRGRVEAVIARLDAGQPDRAEAAERIRRAIYSVIRSAAER